jgi:hypothetical protein
VRRTDAGTAAATSQLAGIHGVTID